jgi:hypothetical protein
MAKIKLTKMNFTDMMNEKIDDMGIEGLFMSTLLGGKEKLKETIADIPNEQDIWVNSDYIVAVTEPVKVAGTDTICFGIIFSHPSEKEKITWIKGEQYDAFIKAWLSKN